MQLSWSLLSRQSDILREITLSGDVDAANQQFAALARRRRSGAAEVDKARTAMLELLAEGFGLDRAGLAEAPVTARDVPPGAMPAFGRDGVEGVSLVTYCMNREDNLRRALSSWLAWNRCCCSELLHLLNDVRGHASPKHDRSSQIQ